MTKNEQELEKVNPPEHASTTYDDMNKGQDSCSSKSTAKRRRMPGAGSAQGAGGWCGAGGDAARAPARQECCVGKADAMQGDACRFEVNIHTYRFIIHVDI